MTAFAEDTARYRAAELLEEERARQGHVNYVTLQPAPFSASPPAPTGDPRAARRAALARRDEVAATLANTKIALARGDDLLQEAEADLAHVAQAAEDDATGWADRLRDWAIAGGRRPRPPADTSDHAAQAHVTAARRARASLADKVNEASILLDQIELLVDAAVRSVLSAEADDLAARLSTHENTARDLREQLSNLSMTWTGHPPAPPPLQYRIVELLRDPPRNAHRTRLDDPELRKPWIAYAKRLTTNPEARIEDDDAA
jgi:hypothetical protein